MDSKTIIKRLDALQAALRPLPTFAEFSAQWGSMDELSKSLILHDLSVEEYAGDKYIMTIGNYLKMMDVKVEPSFSLSAKGKELTGDEP